MVVRKRRGECILSKNYAGRFIIHASVALILAIPLLSIVGLAQTGTLYISSEPGEAEVYIDGIYKGSTPIYNKFVIDYLTVRDIPIGSHTIKITKTGYYDWNKTIQVSAGVETVRATLDIMKGTLEISVEKGIGELYIDGIYKGLVSEGPLPIYIPYGSYVIEIKRESCKDWKQTIQVQKQLTRVVSPFNCTVGIAPQQESVEISFAFEGFSSSYIAGNVLTVDTIVTNAGVTFPIVLSLIDPYGNRTVLPYQYVTIDSGKIHVYFEYLIPFAGPSGTWMVKAEVWDKLDENGTLQTRYDYEEKIFNVSVSAQNISTPTVPAEPVTVATPTGKTIVTKVINSKFGQSNLQINAGDEVLWDNGDPVKYVIVEKDKKIADINLPDNGKTKYIFNTSGNYRFTLNYKYNMLRVSPITQSILVIPPISTPTVTATLTTIPTSTPTSAITETPTPTQTLTPKSTPMPTPGTFGFEAALAISSFLAISYFIRKGN